MKKVFLIFLIPVTLIILSSCHRVKFEAYVVKIEGPNGVVTSENQSFKWFGSQHQIAGNIDYFMYREDQKEWMKIDGYDETWLIFAGNYLWNDIPEGFHTFSVKGIYGSDKETDVIKWYFYYEPED